MRDYGSDRARNRALNNVNTMSGYLSIDSRFSSWQIRSLGSHTLFLLVLLLVFVAVGRVILGGSVSDIRVDTLLPSILESLSSESFSTQLLMDSIREVANIEFLPVSGADAILDILRNIVPLVNMLGAVLMLLVSCVFCATAVIGMVFNLLLVAV